MLANNVLNKVMVYKMCKNLDNSIKKNYPIYKRAEDLKRHFQGSHTNNQERHMKRCSTSVITQLIQDHNEVQHYTHQDSYHQKEKKKQRMLVTTLLHCS